MLFWGKFPLLNFVHINWKNHQDDLRKCLIRNQGWIIQDALNIRDNLNIPMVGSLKWRLFDSVRVSKLEVDLSTFKSDRLIVNKSWDILEHQNPPNSNNPFIPSHKLFFFDQVLNNSWFLWRTYISWRKSAKQQNTRNSAVTKDEVVSQLVGLKYKQHNGPPPRLYIDTQSSRSHIWKELHYPNHHFSHLYMLDFRGVNNSLTQPSLWKGKDWLWG